MPVITSSFDAYKIVVNLADSGSGKKETWYFRTQAGLEKCQRDYQTFGLATIPVARKDGKFFAAEGGVEKEVLFHDLP